MAKIIVYEGPDRVGKATQSKMLQRYLISVGYKVERVEVPVRNIFHTCIYKMLSNGFAIKHPYFFQLVHVMNRIMFQLFSLSKLKRHNDYVIFDRWSLSTWVYGLATGLDKTFVGMLLKPIQHPDFTIILLGQAQVREMRDDYEKDNSLQLRVRCLYEDYYELNSKDTALVRANQTREEVFEQITSLLVEKGIIRKIS